MGGGSWAEDTAMGGPNIIKVEVVSVSSGEPSDLAKVAQPSCAEGSQPSCGWGMTPSSGAVRTSPGRIKINQRRHHFRTKRCRGARILGPDLGRVLDLKPDSVLSIVHPTQRHSPSWLGASSQVNACRSVLSPFGDLDVAPCVGTTRTELGEVRVSPL
jgi:hypothetical protein